ncbi:hypothetical protein AVEN_216892-1 [Araneus ventricosus]|uniref:Uncharacterized protein n=1 Tax=Araneus ventricosus TaxID=182803 RepID=A0A4Y2HTU0_ARAVE|nr:hypothetical protein AVEN_216892-1 [Araneus ventricosus]
MPQTRPLTRSMDKHLGKLFAMMAEMKAGQEEMRVAQAGLNRKWKLDRKTCDPDGRDWNKTEEKARGELQSGQERMEKGQEEMKGMIEEVKGEIQRKVDEVAEKVEMKIEDVMSEIKGKIEEVEHKVQEKIGDIESRLSELEDRPFSFLANPELIHPRPTIKSLTFDDIHHGQSLRLSLML